jgi:hypothetical protein
MLQYDPPNPQLQRRNDLLPLDCRSQHNSACWEPQFAQLSKKLEATQLGQREIQQEHMRFELANHPYRRLLDTEVFDWKCHQYRPFRTALMAGTDPNQPSTRVLS